MNKSTRTVTVNLSGGWGHDVYVSAVYPDGESPSARVYVMDPWINEGGSVDQTPIALTTIILSVAAVIAIGVVVWRRNRRQ